MGARVSEMTAPMDTPMDTPPSGASAPMRLYFICPCHRVVAADILPDGEGAMLATCAVSGMLFGVTKWNTLGILTGGKPAPGGRPTTPDDRPSMTADTPPPASTPPPMPPYSPGCDTHSTGGPLESTPLLEHGEGRSGEHPESGPPVDPFPSHPHDGVKSPRWIDSVRGSEARHDD